MLKGLARYDILLIVVAIVILLIASTYRLSESPAIWYDEGYYTQVAMNMAHFGKEALQVAPGQFVSIPYVTVGYPLFVPLSISYRSFGVGVVQGRAVMVLFILGLALVSFFLIRSLYGTRVAAYALLLLVTFPMLYGNGKSVLGEVPGLFFLVASLWSLSALEKSGWQSLRLWVLTGLLAGLCAATKPIYLLFPATLLIVFLCRIRSTNFRSRGVLVGSLAVLAPIVLWIYLQFYSAATSTASLVSAYANPYEVSSLSALIFSDVKQFFMQVTPLYTLLMVVSLGLALFAARRPRKVSFVELTVFTFSILILLDYLRIAGWYRYFFPATIIALLFLVPSVQALYEWLALQIRPLEKIVWMPLAFIFLLCAGQLYQTVFSSYVASYYGSTKTTDLKVALNAIGPSPSVFLYDTPELGILMPSSNYYQYLHPHPSLEIGHEELAVLARGGADVVIVGNDTYAEESAVFSQYQLSATVHQYVLLKKR